MPDPRRDSESATGDRDAFPGAPRWVKGLAIVAAVVIALVVVIALLAGGDHGPGRHSLGGAASGDGAASVEAQWGGDLG